MMLGSAAR